LRTVFGQILLFEIHTEEINMKIRAGELDLLYFIGDAPYHERPPVKYIVYQNAFPAPSGLKPDLVLPTRIWGETGGSYMSLNGNIKKLKAVASSHRYELSNEVILLKIGKALKVPYKNPVVKNIPVPEFNRSDYNINPVKTSENKKAPEGNEYTYSLIQEKNQHVYCNLNLGEGLTGFGELIKPGHIMINPEDARALGINNYDIAQLTSQDEEKKFRVILRKNIVKGLLFLVTSDGEMEFSTNPCPVNIRRENV